MRIEKLQTSSTSFRDVNIGETFTFSGNDYIKTPYVASNKDIEAHNAVRLFDGSYGTFSGDTKVTPTPNSMFFREYK